MVHLLQMVSLDPTWATHANVHEAQLNNQSCWILRWWAQTLRPLWNTKMALQVPSHLQSTNHAFSYTEVHRQPRATSGAPWSDPSAGFFHPECSRSVQSRCFEVLHLIPSLRSICHGTQFCRASQTWLEGSDPLLVEGLQVIAPHDRQPASVWLMASLSEIV